MIALSDQMQDVVTSDGHGPLREECSCHLESRRDARVGEEKLSAHDGDQYPVLFVARAPLVEREACGDTFDVVYPRKTGYQFVLDRHRLHEPLHIRHGHLSPQLCLETEGYRTTPGRIGQYIECASFVARSTQPFRVRLIGRQCSEQVVQAPHVVSFETFLPWVVYGTAPSLQSVNHEGNNPLTSQPASPQAPCEAGGNRGDQDHSRGDQAPNEHRRVLNVDLIVVVIHAASPLSVAGAVVRCSAAPVNPHHPSHPATHFAPSYIPYTPTSPKQIANRIATAFSRRLVPVITTTTTEVD